MRLYSLSLWSLVYLFLLFFLRDGHPGIVCDQYTGVFFFPLFVCVGISAEQLLGYRATKKRRFFLLLVLFGGEGLMLYVR